MRPLLALLLLPVLLARAQAEYFAAGVLLPCGDPPTRVIAAELDGQPGLDLATAADGAGTVSILRNLGGGQFAAPISVVVEAGVIHYTLCAADLDGDHDQDLIVGHGSHLSILVNDGAGGFTPGAELPTNGQYVARECCAGDVDGDGDQDVLWGNPLLGGGLWLAINQDGVFAPPVELFHYKAADPVLARLDDDPHLDAVCHRESTREVAVLLGRGDGTFQDPVFLPLALSYGFQLRDLAVADMDGDGDPDLAVAASSPSSAAAPDLYTLANLGDGLFGPAVLAGWDSGGPLHSLLAADLDGTGCAELLPVSDGAPRVVWPNDCTGPDLDDYVFVNPPVSARDGALGDLDGDGDLDLAYALAGTAALRVHANVRFAPAVADLSIQLVDEQVALDWSAVAGAMAYRVYRRGAAPGWSLAGETADTQWQEAAPPPPAVGLYRVTALTGRNEAVR
jgi:hypothetical protein